MSNIINYYQSICNTEINGSFSLSKRTREKSEKLNIKIKRTKGLTYDLLLDANKLFNEYFSSFKCDPKFLLNIIYKMELTGALIYVHNVPCIIAEERKNSIIVVYRDNSVKTHIKRGLIFYLEKDNVKYGIIGKNLNLNRFLKK
ncbi:hypothetical protein NCER_101811 [Vairimorpha ceranae BRL01]|uniref:Uncharacterized protein n=2 Tax=Vairimorpha ceranae TaxID=40302 RepID=C4VAT6_VAIC1|nr:ribonuclease-like protein [Vairimorpha ceranae]EEQ81663.1 hypothetical protein NCER_101811 [Vairimorpha ceranae BRL01]KAF5139862.1 hypothetical protein G9O61_00g020320 [Vairimorpha ceranae]KKO74146.1 ribonuclease-like protein [Vairimorpha ceranae]